LEYCDCYAMGLVGERTRFEMSEESEREIA